MTDTRSPGGALVSPALLERFLGRIGDDLEAQPLELPVDEHREDVARRLERAGGESHYELLELGANAGVEAVTRAFSAVGRRVHPAHAERLGLPEPLLRLLFEHATRAYLVLSDPDRRAEYDRLHRPGGGILAPRSDEELQAVRREMARSCFARAQAAMQAERYHTVIELLRDAVRWDARPEMYALLGEAMSRNPRWREAAASQFREAVQLAPREPAYRLRLAHLLEETERHEEAVAEYRQVLQRMPGHPDALAGLQRLDGGSEEGGKRR